ncbi:Fc.00g011850.m01.CDS01 [Cosmosporella sp. VM-42]
MSIIFSALDSDYSTFSLDSSAETLVGSTVIMGSRSENNQVSRPYNPRTATTVREFPQATTMSWPRGKLYNRPDKNTKHSGKDAICSSCPNNFKIHVDPEATYQNLIDRVVEDYTETIDALEYRFVNTYYCGLSQWRQHAYDTNNKPFPGTTIHNLRQKIRARFHVASGKDKAYYRLICSDFRQEQRQRRTECIDKIRKIDRSFTGKISRKFIMTAGRALEFSGKLDIRREFDADMDEDEIAKRRPLAAIKLGEDGSNSDLEANEPEFD